MAKKNNKENRVSNIPKAKVIKEAGEATYKAGMTVADFAKELNKPINEVMKKLIMNGLMINQNESIDRETAELIALDYEIILKDEVITDATRFDEIKIEDDEESLMTRPPVVTIMGHVDHGKTTLLDTIRNSRVTAGEAGGITQRIGAYQIDHNGFKITFIDTPGHAAFSEMRARGASVTDIVILVVAADDGVMPQTEEAISHAKAANCPIIVAVNKIDKPGVNPDNIMSELSRFNLIPEAWGGDTIFCNISALKKIGVDDLLENIELVAEMQELKANPNRLATGTVIEAGLDKNRGAYATLLVQNGTLKIGDYVVCGETYAKIRTMEDDRKTRFKEAKPSEAVVITGLNAVPLAGDKFMVFTSEQEARQIAEERKLRNKAKELEKKKPKTIDDLFNEVDGDKKSLNLIIKTDNQGVCEALRNSIMEIEDPEVKINILRCAAGSITEDDLALALGDNALIIGFDVRPMPAVRASANAKNIQIRLYNVIYEVLDDIKAAIKGMLDPVFVEETTGYCEVRDTFKISKLGTVAGCYVTEGFVDNTAKIRLLRDGKVIYEGKLSSLKHLNDFVKSVKQGFECGIMLEGFNDIKVGDYLEATVMKEVKNG